MEKKSNNTTFIAIVAAIIIAILFATGALNTDGTSVKWNGFGGPLDQTAPTTDPTLVGTQDPGVDPMGTAQALAYQTAMAQGLITPTATLLPGQTPTVGPTTTPVPIVIQMGGDLDATVRILATVQTSYQSSQIIAGEMVACGASETSTTVSPGWVARKLGIVYEKSTMTQTMYMCATIMEGWKFSDLQIDWAQSKVGIYQTVSTTIDEQNRTVIVQKPTITLVLVAKQPACLIGVNLSRGNMEYALTQVPSTTWQILAPIFGISYTDTGQVQKLYNEVYDQVVSDGNLKQAREQAHQSLLSGPLYQDMKNLILEVGNWASVDFVTQIPTTSGPYTFCSDGSSVFP